MAQDILDKDIGWMYSYDGQVQILDNFCPGSITKIFTSENLYNQTLYQISAKSLNRCLDEQ